MELISFMNDPAVYPEKTSSVNFVQTHHSWVFICDNYVYKLKKPVNLGFLDFTTAEKRRFYVNEELRLNTRFSPDVYLNVVPISKIDGSFIIGDDSDITETALRMKRIDENGMLLNLLKKGQAGADDIKRLGGRLAEIYAAIPSDDKARSFGGLDTISFNIIENFDQTRGYIGGPVSTDDFRLIESWSLKFMEDNAGLFDARLNGGFIKEGHGDLHLQHIFLFGDSITILDCIDFNERFRYGDAAQDIAFLAMDLDHNGYDDLARVFVDSYISASGDSSLQDVLSFYKIYRAYVRAKVNSFMSGDSGMDSASRKAALERAAEYYRLAAGYVRICL
jgi:aminoglycoside phosphotransferase family enzyme